MYSQIILCFTCLDVSLLQTTLISFKSQIVLLNLQKHPFKRLKRPISRCKKAYFALQEGHYEGAEA